MSPTDLAALKLEQVLSEGKIISVLKSDLNESDTRAKLIDPIFKELLGWTESEITREEPAAQGYADYVFGAEYRYFHVEAKRERPRFRLNVPSRSRVLELSGPHLLGQHQIKKMLEQVAKYAIDLGTDFSILTNGDQFILFRNRLPGRSWKTGRAIVWHDLKDIQDNFAEFYSLLSRDEVKAGSLHVAFDEVQDITCNLYLPRTALHNPDAEYVRNSFWSKIASVFGPLLTDQPTDAQLQDEIIRNCYVRTRLSDQADKSIDNLIRDLPQKYLSEAGVKDLKVGMDGKTGFEHSLESDIKERIINTYILTGGVGSGKTTFLRRFEKVVGASLLDHYCVWLHIDFLAAGSVNPSDVEEILSRQVFKEIRTQLESKYGNYIPSNGEAIRELFSAEIEELLLTKLHGVQKDSKEWNEIVNERVHDLFSDDETFCKKVLLSMPLRGRRVVIVLDNTDQLGEIFQENVFLFSQKISKECGSLTIVALREEKFFAAHRRGVFDAYGDRRFHIGAPDLKDVIKARLEYGLKKYIASSKDARSEESRDISDLIKIFIMSATQSNQNIVRLLACVSNGDMRHALAMFREFVSSGNTDIEKIISTYRNKGSYTVPFHEFAKSAILGSKKYFNSSVSHTVNLFLRTPARQSSHLTACRLLARLTSAQQSPSRFGPGFVDSTQLISEYRQSFGQADDFILRVDELLRRGLIESEPPRAETLLKTDALRISASGAYYWQYLIRSFAYLDLVYIDTPFVNKLDADRLAGMSGHADLTVRFERVRCFLDILKTEENLEIAEVVKRGGPYASRLIPDIIEQIEKEIAEIVRKTGAFDLNNE